MTTIKSKRIVQNVPKWAILTLIISTLSRK